MSLKLFLWNEANVWHKLGKSSDEEVLKFIPYILGSTSKASSIVQNWLLRKTELSFVMYSVHTL